jgi:Stress responsive A/B Barrel Domain
MIRHIVTWKLKAEDPDAKAAAFDRLAAGFGSLPHLIPGIKTLHMGRDLDEIASNWDVVLILDVASTKDLDAYQVHPEHEKVKQIVRELTGERSAIDFEL